MFVAKTLLTLSAVVKVLADTALVAQSLDRGHTAAITADTLVDDFSLLSRLLGSGKLLRLEKLLEDVLSLLVELIVDEVLKSLTG